MTEARTDHRRQMIAGPAGRLEALLWASGAGTAPPLAAIVCHPHPLYGGAMHNKVVYQAAKTLHRFGLPVLRFNFRGVGLSEGSYDRGRGEADDARAALEFLAAEYPGVALLAAGFSFGAWVGLRAGCGDARVAELAGIGLPVNDLDCSYLRECAKPMLFLQGAEDEYGAPGRLRSLLATLPPDAAAATRLVVIPGADHFFTDRVDRMTGALAEWVAERHPEISAAES
jgi:uncharacterized protein